jgi:hypothetical protein
MVVGFVSILEYVRDVHPKYASCSREEGVALVIFVIHQLRPKA